jgi:hypothetical protein
MLAAMNRRLMYIESKSQAIDGRGRIGWVERSTACRVYHYGGRVLRISTEGRYNCFDAGSGERYLVAEPKANGADKLNGGLVDIDDDAREEYWLRVRKRPDCVALDSFQAESRRGK